MAGVQPQTRTRRRDKALPASLCTHAMGWVWVHTPRDQPALTSAPLLPEAAAAWILLSDPQNLLGPPSPRLPLTAARPGGSWQRPGCPYTTPRPHIAPRGPPHTRKPPKIPPTPLPGPHSPSAAALTRRIPNPRAGAARARCPSRPAGPAGSPRLHLQHAGIWAGGSTERGTGTGTGSAAPVPGCPPAAPRGRPASPTAATRPTWGPPARRGLARL